ncbi:hypothetical protein K438DRAFT_2023723 [Mycena galopus ATCC 62051]|nr:hypothetical protein K438DRAFT_2023723 [Mycena galopus ATCC 62051]
MPSRSSIVPLATTHNLGNGDRARLIRSTRKIEAVVGETPQVVDPLEPTLRPTKAKALRNKLAPSIPGMAPPPPSEGRPVLYLRVPSPPPESILTLTTPAPSPTLTVTLKPPTRDEAWRKRTMAKLRRTLGVNIPTDLVFPPENTNTPPYRRLTSRTLPSADRRKSRVESKRQSYASQRSRGGRTPVVDPDEDTDISRGWVWVGKRDDLPVDVVARIKRSRKESGLPFGWTTTGRLPEDLDEDVDEEEPPSPSSGRALHRKEVGWSGEWAGMAHNMNEVLHRLRDLKVK